MKLFLIGYRCTGKTTIGKTLASLLEYSFMDTDRAIEAETGKSISELVAGSGWKAFRELEHRMLLKTHSLENSVIATGGGIILDPANKRFMKQSGTVVLLTADLATIAERMATDDSSERSRPSLTGSDCIQEVGTVLNERMPIYLSAADFTIDTTHFPPDQAAREIARRLHHGRQ